jgi:hypothetical protein
VTDVPGQFDPEGDLSDNGLKLVEQLYGDPEIPPCPVCGEPRVLMYAGESNTWGCLRAFRGEAARRDPKQTEHYEQSRYRQRRHGDRDVMRLIAEVRRRRQVETGHAGAEPVTEVDPRQASIFDLLHLGGPS